MIELLGISKSDIAKLKDDDLRELIGILCETEYRQAGLSTNGIRWGGHQDASDGGIDVIVDIEQKPPNPLFALSGPIAFQVKRPNMTKSLIKKEMRPKGHLREEIKNIIASDGAYIIVSSGASVTEAEYRKRIQAMREAVTDVPGGIKAKLDFLDSNQIATWVRTHPALVLWVKNRTDRPIIGWSSYGNWASCSRGIQEEYLTDDELRIRNSSSRKSKADQTVLDGIDCIRKLLQVPGASLRLSGLSGVGKTRFAQALFDIRIGRVDVNPYQVIYSDISLSPTPDPITVATLLQNESTHSILIVDNCAPELHKSLTTICTKPGSKVSLLTVEYDVRDDEPEETYTFQLEPSSDKLIENLLLKTFSHLTYPDAKRIADFSGGNSRVAILLARTLKKGESISSLKSEELFQRLFYQRNAYDENLQRSAEILSLVYSFDGVNVSKGAELDFLATLCGKSVNDLYRDVETLRKRNMIQSRGDMRAILPHVIANRLATSALESTPKGFIANSFTNGASERLILSFVRRLTYLYELNVSQAIAQEWLSPEGWIGVAKGEFNPFSRKVFLGLAPVNQEATLSALENFAEQSVDFASRSNMFFNEHVRILYHIAFEDEFFERCVNLLLKFALTEKPDENRDSIRKLLKSLFYIKLSGSNSLPSTRFKVIEDILESESREELDIAFSLLDATLKTIHFDLLYPVEFGARQRNYGYSPKSNEEASVWFYNAIDLILKCVLAGGYRTEGVGEIFANRLRGLCRTGVLCGFFEQLENVCLKINESNSWYQGWDAIQSVLEYDLDKYPEEYKPKLRRLETQLRPKTLLDLSRAFLYTEHMHVGEKEGKEMDNDIASYYEIENRTVQLGTDVAVEDGATLNSIMPDLYAGLSQRAYLFGRGLGAGAGNKKEMWNRMADFYREQYNGPNIGVLTGFLSGIANEASAVANEILDELLEDPVLGKNLPLFQTSIGIDDSGYKRIAKALETNLVDANSLVYIAYGKSHESVSDDDLAKLLDTLAERHDSSIAALEILMMRFHNLDSEGQVSTALLESAQKILLNYEFGSGDENYRDTYRLEVITGVVLKGPQGASIAAKLLKKFKIALLERRIHSTEYQVLLRRVASNQPIAFMDHLVTEEVREDYRLERVYDSGFNDKSNPIAVIPDETILKWCNVDPVTRFEIMADLVDSYEKVENEKRLVWKPIFYTIIDEAFNLRIVLDRFADSLWPRSWVGSYAEVMDTRAELFTQLFDHKNNMIVDWATQMYTKLKDSAQKERENEERERREEAETFE